jgi:hypothetical protein
MSSTKFSERLVFKPALEALLLAWATVTILSILLLLSPFVPSFAGIGRTLVDLLPADISAWPIYTT